jgi:monoamine oxidase
MPKEQLIIVGAGMAGLVMARELAKDYEITILEAADRSGGRVLTINDDSFPFPLEAGAEFIHGHLKHTMDLLKEAGIEYIPVEGKMYDMDKGEWKVLTLMAEEWDLVLKQMKKLTKDMTMYDFLQVYFPEDKYYDLRRHCISYTESFDVADVKKISVMSLYKEWTNEEHADFRVPAGFTRLVDFITTQCELQGCDIRYNEVVKLIKWNNNEVTAFTSEGERYVAAKAVITISMGVLKDPTADSAIRFEPPLDEQFQAVGCIGFGPAMKVKLLFKKRFWKPDTAFILNDEIFPTWWTQLPDTLPMLTGWAGGPKAGILSTETEDSILQKALSSLGNIFGLPVQMIRSNLKAHRIFNWQQNNYSNGAYSYAIPGSEAAIELLNQPVMDTIFFCGEGLYTGTAPGTMEAAITHAMQTAEKLKK